MPPRAKITGSGPESESRRARAGGRITPLPPASHRNWLWKLGPAKPTAARTNSARRSGRPPPQMRGRSSSARENFIPARFLHPTRTPSPRPPLSHSHGRAAPRLLLPGECTVRCGVARWAGCRWSSAGVGSRVRRATRACSRAQGGELGGLRWFVSDTRARLLAPAGAFRRRLDAPPRPRSLSDEFARSKPMRSDRVRVHAARAGRSVPTASPPQSPRTVGRMRDCVHLQLRDAHCAAHRLQQLVAVAFSSRILSALVLQSSRL